MKSVLKHTKATVFPDGCEEPKHNQQLWHEAEVAAATRREAVSQQGGEEISV